MMSMAAQALPAPRGFRYTPSSYLHNLKSENRPWTGDEEDAGDMALKQEFRPPRKHTTIDANFSARIQRRKDLYRGIIKGDYEVESLHNDDVDELERSLSLIDESDNGNGDNSNNVTEQARQARRQRLKGNDQPVLSSTSGLSQDDSEAARVRNMRAQRIREAKKLSTEEDSLGEKLRLRRQQQKEQERIDQELEARLQQEILAEQRRMEQERIALAEERRLLEAAKQAAAMQDARRRQRPPSPQEKSPQERFLQETPSKAPPRKIRRAASETSLPELSLLEEVEMLFRESGILKTCVASCFGDDSEIRTQKRRFSKHRDIDLSDGSSDRSFELLY